MLFKFIKRIIVVFILNLILVEIIRPISVKAQSFCWPKDETVETSVENYDLKLESESAILIEQKTGQVLYEKNSHEKLRPASVTKVMGILLIMEALDRGQIKLDDMVTCSENASSMGGSQIWFEPGEQLSVDDCLKAICVVSANDCIVAMAEHLAGSEEAFVEKMNLRAKELGMNDTCFKNCHGIDEDGHVTSSYDISLMARELLENHSNITKYTTIWMDSLRDGKSQLTNTNKLVRTYDGCTGLKTGSTSLALYNLAASATRNNFSLITVVMRAPTTKLRFGEAKKLLDFGFNNYEYSEFGKKDEVYEKILLEKSTVGELELVAENDFGAIVKKGTGINFEKEINIDENIEVPINKGDVLGNVKVKNEDEVIMEVNLVAAKDAEKRSFFNMCEYIIRKYRK